MNPTAVLERIAAADRHEGGLRVARCADIARAKVTAMADEVALLRREFGDGSDVTDPGHVTNWTRPIGEAHQLSLWNRSGSVNDFSDDHDLTIAGKAFHHAAMAPTIARFIAALPTPLNMRVNILGPESRLSPHEEHVTLGRGEGWGLRARFHLPLQTNSLAFMEADGGRWRFTWAHIYFFNNGCIHAAGNDHPSAERIHLVWDTVLTDEALAYYFGTATVPGPEFDGPPPEVFAPSDRLVPLDELVGPPVAMPWGLGRR